MRKARRKTSAWVTRERSGSVQGNLEYLRCCHYQPRMQFCSRSQQTSLLECSKLHKFSLQAGGGDYRRSSCIE